jgi:hypothetical protein
MPRIPPPRPEYLQFLSAYEPRITKLALAVRKLVLSEAPGSTELLYDAYNAVAAGYSFTGRPSDHFIHIASYAGWVNIGFNHGADLPDPHRILQGAGRQVRHIRIAREEDLDAPAVRHFVKAAIARAIRPEKPIAPASVVRAIYARKRRPVGAASRTR